MRRKNIITGVVIIIVALGVAYSFKNRVAAPAPERLLTEAQVKNAIINNVQFVNGEYLKTIHSTDKGGEPISWTESGDIRDIVFGDYDGDGYDDAVVVYAENLGGTGNFRSVALIWGDPKRLNFYAGSGYFGDRVGWENLKIEKGRITLDVGDYGTNFAEPSGIYTPKFFVLEDGELVER